MVCWQAVIGWIATLWLAAGIEGALGRGMPGPVFLVALAAGLSAGPRAAMLIAAGAGLCASAVSGIPLLPVTLGCLVVASSASLLARWFSTRNLLVCATAAFVTSALAALLFALSAHQSLAQAGEFAIRRGGENALWIFAIYSIVLVVSSRSSRQIAWEE
jgi:hypothetical protein